MRTVLFTSLALVAFAANSVLCRMALGGSAIDAASFSAIRLGCGAIVLLALSARRTRADAPGGSWTSAGLLFLYAVPFSFAYTRLSAGTGALILFGCVQVTMMAAAIGTGERPGARQWAGLGAALAGLVYLVGPGLTAPPAAGAALMAIAGVAWGLYSLRGRRTTNALAQTTRSFVRSLPFVLAMGLAALPHVHVSWQGAILAAVSGAVTSGLGYVVWYLALVGLTAARAAVVQLAVPILAAAGGVVVLHEIVTVRLLWSSALVLGGVGLAIAGRQQGSRG
jgi:drug/metabolite transporter (DMT)-like permease